MIQRRWAPFFKRQNLSSCKKGTIFLILKGLAGKKNIIFFLVVLAVNPRTKSPCLAWTIFVHWIWPPKRKQLRRRRICMWSTSKKWLRWLTTWPGREGTSAILCLFVGCCCCCPSLFSGASPFPFPSSEGGLPHLSLHFQLLLSLVLVSYPTPGHGWMAKTGRTTCAAVTRPLKPIDPGSRSKRGEAVARFVSE